MVIKKSYQQIGIKLCDNMMHEVKQFIRVHVTCYSDWDGEWSD